MAQCLVPSSGGTVDENQCQATYKEAVSGCSAAAKFKRFTRRQDGANATVVENSSPDLFDHIDADGSGNITLSEYLDFVNFTLKGALDDARIAAQWINHFASFDKDNDGVVPWGEHE